MSYVRSKMINGYGPYYYLVKSERVGGKSRQIHIAYLGKNAKQHSGTATASTLSAANVSQKDINTTHDIQYLEDKKPQETKKMENEDWYEKYNNKNKLCKENNEKMSADGFYLCEVVGEDGRDAGDIKIIGGPVRQYRELNKIERPSKSKIVVWHTDYGKQRHYGGY